MGRVLHDALLTWYREARRDLPWRRARDPYAIWLSEVMLQQTRVETVIPYYARFLRTYPDVHALAEAPLDDVLAHWSGLGYYRRARMLHEGAKHVAGVLGGHFPDTVDGLREIPGIGPYTAGAVASIAFGRRAPLVDGNVARVLSRLFAVADDVRGGAGLAKIWQLADELVDARDPGAWNQALMELGATVCLPREPRCVACPAEDVCLARARGVERDLPRLKAKPKPILEVRVAMVALLGERVLLARRRTEGRFGGMWEPPSVVAADETRLRALVGTKLGRVERLGEIVHVLSHRRLEVTVLRARMARAPRPRAPEGGDYDRLELVEACDLAGRGTTTLARKILAAAGVA
jgi:A/G-specific adenine glycosylase